MKLQILDKYLFFRILSSSILSVLSLLAIFVFFKFLEELEHVGTESYSLITAIQYITFLIPSILNSVAILGIMIGTILSIGAMNHNRELLIYSVNSISLKHIILRILKSSFIILGSTNTLYLPAALYELIILVISSSNFRFENVDLGLRLVTAAND